MPDTTITNLLDCFQLIGDPNNAALIEPYLYLKNATLADTAIWTLCWIGVGQRSKSYILEAAEPGFPWNPERKVAASALLGAGLHLKTHRDRDFAQLILRWALRWDDDDFYDHTLSYSALYPLPRNARDACFAAGYAMGADPFELTENEELLENCIARFAAERQDG